MHCTYGHTHMKGISPQQNDSKLRMSKRGYTPLTKLYNHGTCVLSVAREQRAVLVSSLVVTSYF